MQRTNIVNQYCSAFFTKSQIFFFYQEYLECRSRDCPPSFFPDSIPSGPLINRLKYFQILLRFRRENLVRKSRDTLPLINCVEIRIIGIRIRLASQLALIRIMCTWLRNTIALLTINIGTYGTTIKILNPRILSVFNPSVTGIPLP